MAPKAFASATALLLISLDLPFLSLVSSNYVPCPPPPYKPKPSYSQTFSQAIPNAILPFLP